MTEYQYRACDIDGAPVGGWVDVTPGNRLIYAPSLEFRAKPFTCEAEYRFNIANTPKPYLSCNLPAGHDEKLGTHHRDPHWLIRWSQ